MIAVSYSADSSGAAGDREQHAHRDDAVRDLHGFDHAEVGDGAAQLGVDDPAERPADLVLGGGGGHGVILGGPRGGVFVAHGTLRPTSPCARARAAASAS